MDVIKKMIVSALQADDQATVGLRALLSQATTPYGIYHAILPTTVSFASSKKYITYFQLTTNLDLSYPRVNMSTVPKQETYQITVWGGDTTTSNDKILARVRWILDGKRKVTNPTADASVYDIKLEWEGPDMWDEDLKIWTKSSRFRVWLGDNSNV